MIYKSKSREDTQKIARDFAKQLTDTGGVVALIGELGAGKTTFAQGFAQSLGIDEKVISPTFILIRHYKIPNSAKTFHHIDLYRLEKNTDFDQIGIGEILENKNQDIVLIEWADKLAEETLKKAHNLIILHFQKISDNNRNIEIIHQK